MMRWASKQVFRSGSVSLVAALVLVLTGGFSGSQASFDPAFGSGPNPGVVQMDTAPWPYPSGALAVLADGSIITATREGVRRHSAAGVMDSSFGQFGSGLVELGAIVPVDVSVDRAGRILVTGSRDDTGTQGSIDPVIIRMTARGVIDDEFVGSVAPFRYEVSAPIQFNDRIVVSSVARSTGQVCLHRLVAAQGTLDSTFGSAFDGHSCVSRSGVASAVGALNDDQTYTLYVHSLAGNMGSRVEIINFGASGRVMGATRTIAAEAGQVIESVLVTADGGLLLALSDSNRGGVALRKYINGVVDPSFVASTTLSGFEAFTGDAQLFELPDRRIVFVGGIRDLSGGGPGQTFARLQLLTANGLRDAALAPGAARPDQLTLPRGSYDRFQANNATIYDAANSAGRLVLLGAETRMEGDRLIDKNEILARTGIIGPSAPIEPAVLVGPASATETAVRLGR